MKTHQQSETPQAFVLVEWPKDPTKEHPKHYYLHLHFNSFGREQKLTGISHAAVKNLPHRMAYVYREVDKEHLTVTVTNRDDYKHLVEKTKKFANDNNISNLQWNNKETWKMTEAVPTNLIRSRTDMIRIGTDILSYNN